MNEKIVEGEWTGPRIYTFGVYGWLTEVGRPKWRWMVLVRITWNELIPLLPTPRTPLFTSSLRDQLDNILPTTRTNHLSTDTDHETYLAKCRDQRFQMACPRLRRSRVRKKGSKTPC